MRPLDQLRETLDTLGDQSHYLFQASDFSALFPCLTPTALYMLLGRATRSGLLRRVCYGVYYSPRLCARTDFILYHTAAKLRSREFCYLSLESILSENGIISQIPLGWITVMTGGRSGEIRCGSFGHIEFVHTRKSPETLAKQLAYDAERRLWCASVALALQDMKSTRRPMDLIESETRHDAF